jgi:hypothetical protein
MHSVVLIYIQSDSERTCKVRHASKVDPRKAVKAEIVLAVQQDSSADGQTRTLRRREVDEIHGELESRGETTRP